MTARSFDPLAPGAMDAAVLLATRIAALVLIAPIYSAVVVPKMLRAALIVLLTVVLLPLAAPAVGAAALTPASFASESLVGFAMGLGAALLVAGAETAGDLLAVQTGLSGAATLDPTSQTSAPSLAEFFRLLVLTLLLVTGGHLLSIEALVRSVKLVPLGAPVDVRAGLGAMASMGGSLFLLGLRFAAPVTAAVLVSNLALGIVSRVVPQLNALAVAYPVQIAVGLVALLAAIPFVGAFIAGWPLHYADTVDHLLAALAGRGGR
ncbi:MAG: flagellar biosynthetic protein FliR [Gemmatimonadetes bacterium]|nr:flagellar biosynthetic protein FliR [Gemmatimonadota bacterium]